MVTVRGSGSKWTNTGSLSLAGGSNGRLAVEAGGQVTSCGAIVGTNGYRYYYPPSNMAVVTGTGSTWTDSGTLEIGEMGILAVADGGKIGTKTLRTGGTVNLGIIGNDMIVLGDAQTTGSIVNDGEICLYASAFESQGVYTPISEHAGRSINWSGTGRIKGFGGRWDNESKTFNIPVPIMLPAGSASTFQGGDRVIFTDPGSGKQVGLSFEDWTGRGWGEEDIPFSAELMDDDELTALARRAPVSVLGAWRCLADMGMACLIMSFDIGTGSQDFMVWLFDDESATWEPYQSDFAQCAADGIISFQIAREGGFAVTTVPEPATIGLLTFGGLAMLRRRRK